mmetsp:Transcript_107728/g.310174  ORF Transcript_107728/g.310174 Transcript_107728/m.310174 type:complete len:366 (-) Transcript_107728:261-1358(-)
MRADVARDPSVLAQGVALRTQPRPGGAVGPGDLRERSEKILLLLQQVRDIALLLVPQAVDATEQRIKKTPLGFLTSGHIRIPVVDRLCCENFRGPSELPLEVLAPIAVTVEPPDAHRANELFLNGLHDRPSHVLVNDPERIDQEEESCVRLALPSVLYALIGQDLLQSLGAFLFDGFQRPVLARHHHAWVLVQKLPELLRCSKHRSDAGRADAFLLLPWASVLIPPILNLHEVFDHETQKSEVIAGHGHLPVHTKTASQPDEVAQGVVLLVIPELIVLLQCLPVEPYVGPEHRVSRIGVARDNIVQPSSGLQEKGCHVTNNGRGLRGTVPVDVRRMQRHRHEHVIADPDVLVEVHAARVRGLTHP